MPWAPSSWITILKVSTGRNLSSCVFMQLAPQNFVLRWNLCMRIEGGHHEVAGILRPYNPDHRYILFITFCIVSFKFQRKRSSTFYWEYHSYWLGRIMFGSLESFIQFRKWFLKKESLICIFLYSMQTKPSNFTLSIYFDSGYLFQ